MKLTERLTDALAAKLELPPGRSDEVWWDAEQEGFGLRGRRQKTPPYGITKRWWFQCKDANGKTHKESLGDPRRIKAEAAREISRRRAAAIELGEDLSAKRDKDRADAQAQRLRFGALVARYLLAKKPKLRKSSYTSVAYCLEKLCKDLHPKPVGAIGLAGVAAVIDGVERANGVRSASLARRSLITLFGWAAKRGLISANPAALTEDPGKDLKPRKRVLSDEELKMIWAACSDDNFGRIVKLLILTAARRDEIGALSWHELDPAGVMTIPGSRTKTGEPLQLALPRQALEVVRDTPRRGLFLFAVRKDQGFGKWAAAKMALDLRIAAMSGRVLERWVLHDLRRTARTGMARLGIRPDVCERVLNHTPPAIQRVYDLHSYALEVQQALAVWANHVEAVVEGRSTQVMPIRRGA